MPESQPIASNADTHNRTDAVRMMLLRRLADIARLKHTSTLRNPLAFVFLALIVAFVTAGFGCGTGGAVAFDGGHVPIGGGSGSRIAGVAFVAEDVSLPVPNAIVTVTNNSVTGAKRTQTTTTDKNGAFIFGFVPDAANVNQYQISVVPPAGSLVLPQQISFPVNANTNASILVALPKITFDQSLPASLAVTPAKTQLHSGDTVRITAQLFDAAGNPLPVSPSVVFNGNFGFINPDGLFTSTDVGSGTITAYWNTGAALLQSNVANVIADTVSPYQPPPPPIVTPTQTKAK